MLVIRKEQMEALSQYRLKGFEDRMVIQLQKTWTEECADLGEAGVWASIRKGIERAKGYGIETEHDISRYINIMYALGHDFDTDARYPWASAFLNDHKIPATRKMDRLCEWTSRELDSHENYPTQES